MEATNPTKRHQRTENEKRHLGNRAGRRTLFSQRRILSRSLNGAFASSSRKQDRINGDVRNLEKMEMRVWLVLVTYGGPQGLSG